MEDLFEAEEVINAHDPIELFEHGYFLHAKRWIQEASGQLADNAYEVASQLKDEMFQQCVNNRSNIEEIFDLADNLSSMASDLRMRIELVELLAAKARDHFAPDK